MLKLNMENGVSKISLIDPFFFIMRRIFFVFAAIFMQDFLWGQLAMQFSCSVILIIFFGYHWPFVDPMITKLEIMNECQTICRFLFVLASLRFFFFQNKLYKQLLKKEVKRQLLFQLLCLIE